MRAFAQLAEGQISIKRDSPGGVRGHFPWMAHNHRAGRARSGLPPALKFPVLGYRCMAEAATIRPGVTPSARWREAALACGTPGRDAAAEPACGPGRLTFP